jgi:hypothetical protein
MGGTAASHRILRRLGLGIFKRLIPNEEVEDLTRQWYPQMRRRALTVGTVLGLLMVAQLEKVTGAVDELLIRGWGRIRRSYGLAHVARPVSRQAFSKRLKTLPWEIFRGLFGVLFSACGELWHPAEGLYHGLYTIQAIDGSVVNVAARLVKAWAGIPGRGGKVGRKAQAKVHTMFNVTLGLPAMVNVTGARRSEIRQARKLVREAVKRGPTIVVTDLGYFAFDFFYRMMEAGAFFVARLKERTKYRRIKKLGRRDWLVRVGITAKTQRPIIVRLVGVREGDEIYWYLTNLMPEHGITPADVRSLYRKRWLVELFFKAWKHVLEGGRFFCYNTNGIKIQIYASLCAYVLVKMLVEEAARRYRFDAQLVGFQRAAAIVRCWMYQHWESLWSLRPRRRILDDLLEQIAILGRALTRSEMVKNAQKRRA